MGLSVPATKIRTVSVDPFIPTVDSVGTWAISIPNASIIKGGYLNNSTLAQNDYVAWDIFLPAGTWKVGTVVRTGTSRAIMSVQLDSVEVAALDMYLASTVDNTIVTASGIVVAATGMKRLKLKMANKNASSSGYGCFFNTIGFVRTA